MLIQKVFYITLLSLAATLPVLSAPKPNNDVIHLTAEDFNQIIESDTAWVVLFHSKYCGRCKRFVPFYEKMATNVKLWNALLKIASLDCESAKHLPICKDFETSELPALQYFEDHFFPNSSRQQPNIEPVLDDEQLEFYLIDLMIEEQKVGKGDVYPKIAPYTGPAENLTDKIERDHVYLIVDEEGSYLGPQVTLDVHNATNTYVRYTFNYNIIEGIKYYDLPILLRANIHDDPITFTVIEVKQTREAFAEELWKNDNK